jgi:hypothetical protein
MTAVQVSAQDLFRAAYENRYTWDADFPGYTADVTLTMDGETFSGKAQVNSNMTAEVFDVADEQAQKLIHGQLWETSIHRVRRTFEQTHGENIFSYGAEDESGAIEILMGGKAAGDRYKVKDNEVVLVHRHIHGTVITINTFTTQKTEEGYLSHTYDSVYHDPKTGEQKGGKSEFEDTYEKVGNYYILSRRVIRTETNGRTATNDFVFSNIKLLAPKAA